jgi:uracil-DNA glycosylase
VITGNVSRSPASLVPAGAAERERRHLELVEHQSQIRHCVRCVEAGFIAEAWPVFHGTADRRLMIVGQAPAARRAERPLPFSGASGRTLRQWLARAGFEPDDLHQRFYLTSLTKCFPGASTSGKGDRAPSRTEIALCRPHLERELELIRPVVILALGRLSATYFVGNRPLGTMVGEAFPYRGAQVLPLPHPSGVSRWLNEPANQALLDHALDRLNHLRLSIERGSR